MKTGFSLLDGVTTPCRGSVYLSFDRANKEGECWPAVPTISRELKLSEATVRRAILSQLCYTDKKRKRLVL